MFSALSTLLVSGGTKSIMASKITTSSSQTHPRTTIEEPDLSAWLSAKSGEKRELIVEAKVPERKVLFQRDSNGRSTPVGIASGTPSDRNRTLTQLYSLLADSVEVPPVLLKAAGAVAVRASSREVQKFVAHPLVKRIRSNRKLRKSA